MIDIKDTASVSEVEDVAGEGLEEVRLRQQAIGVKLRHMFDEIVNEPIPDEFLEILKTADNRSNNPETI